MKRYLYVMMLTSFLPVYCNNPDSKMLDIVEGDILDIEEISSYKDISLDVMYEIGDTYSEDISDIQGEELITPYDSPQTPSRGFFMGGLPVPTNGESFADAYAKQSGYSEFVPVWGQPTPFYALAEVLSGSWGEEFVDGYIRGNRMFPLINMSFIDEDITHKDITLISPPEIGNATLSNPMWRAAYKKAAIDIVKASHPLLFSLGNEVNRWYEKYGMDGENGFSHYISLYEEIYDEVKKLSPDTKVYCVFAREIVSKNRVADMSVIKLFNPEKLDLLVITSYPYATGRSRPAKIENDYYSAVASYIPDRPFGFSEVAWPSLDVFGGEQGQADFLMQIAGRLTKDRGINLYLIGWAWFVDLDEKDTIGLIKRDGTEKLGYKVWKDIFGW
ncbi:MAG: hypothetical protein ACP5KG_05355 [Myxococcota bacterium]